MKQYHTKEPMEMSSRQQEEYQGFCRGNHILISILAVLVIGMALISRTGSLLDSNYYHHSRGVPGLRQGSISSTYSNPMYHHHDDPYLPSISSLARGYPWAAREVGNFSSEALNAISNVSLKGVTATQGLVLVGYLCRSEDASRRELIRTTNGLLAPRGVSYVFVICHPLSNEEPDPNLWSEIQDYGDIFLINCRENMNEGKTRDYFKVVARKFPNYYFYAKTDMDSYVYFHNLAAALDQIPKCGIYFGSRFWYGGPPGWYMIGHFYALSKDLVVKLAACTDNMCTDSGNEDNVLSENLHKAAVVYKEFDYANVMSHTQTEMHLEKNVQGLSPYFIWAHGLKDDLRWWDAHLRITELITKDTVNASMYENFYTYGDDAFPDINCTEPVI